MSALAIHEAPAVIVRRGPVLTTRRAAEYCGIAHRTLRNLLALNRGPKSFKQGRLNVFYPADLDALSLIHI